MSFKKANPQGRRLKILLCGDAGAGKTMTAVQFIDPAVKDLEDKAMSFADAYKFDISLPSFTEPAEILAEMYNEIEELQRNPGPYKTLVIDSASTYTDLLIDKHLRRLREKHGSPNYTLKPLDYKTIKAEIKSFVSKLMLLDMNVVLTARMKKQYDPDSGEMMKVIGTEPDAHKEFPALFHIIIELIGQGKQPRTAVIRRDNTRRLPEIIEDFSFQKLMTYFEGSGYAITAEAEAVQETDQKRASLRSTAIQFKGKELFTAGITAKTLERLFDLVEKDIISEAELMEKIRIDYPGAERVLDLREDEGQMLLADVLGETND